MLGDLFAPAPLRHFDDLRAWWSDHLACTAHLALPVDRAMLGAQRVDRLGYAFAGGYAAALSALIPALPPGACALAATEEGGAHPRAIHTTLHPDGAGYRLEGHKRWVTLGTQGGALLVVARLPELSTDGRPRLKLVRVDAARPGVRLRALPAAPFVPEIPHAELELSAVRVSAAELLPGDGYTRYLKPFRTVEDIHVHAALLAWLLSVGLRASWPEDQVERLAALAAAVRGLALEDPRAPGVHLALAGLITESHASVDILEPCWALVDAELRERWQRDRPLLGVAASARVKRREAAWDSLRARGGL